MKNWRSQVESLQPSFKRQQNAFCISLILLGSLLLGIFNLQASYAQDMTSTITIYVGQTFELKPYLISQNVIKEGTPSFTSVQKEVASVSSTGVVMGVKAGQTIVSATTSSGSTIKEAKVKVIVLSGVSKISLSEGSKKLVMGQFFDLKATLTPVEGLAVPYEKTVIWTSNNPLIAKVDTAGRVTATGVGKTIIYALSKDGSRNDKCEIEVVNILKDIKYEQSEQTLSVGEEKQLTLSYTPADAPVKDVSYKSSNAAVATVSATGLVVGKTAGDCQIIVYSADGNRGASLKVTVKSRVSSVKLDRTYLELDDINKTQTLVATLIPIDTAKPPLNSTVTWKSSSPTVVSVDANGQVTALKSGQVNITVTTADGGYMAQCTVKSTILKTGSEKVVPSLIELIDPPKVAYAGQAVTVNYKVYPESSTVRKVSVKSSPGTTIATVVTEGQFVFTPTQVGNHVVTAAIDTTTVDFNLEVRPSVRDAEILTPTLERTGSNAYIYLGQDTKLTFNFALSGIERKEFNASTLKWVYDTSLIKLEKDPEDPYSVKVKLLRPNTAVIEATILDGSVKARVNLVYEPMAQSMSLADQALINLNYSFKPELTLTAKEKLRYGYTSVLDSSYDMYLDEVYIDTDFLVDEIAYEKENIPALKAMADKLSSGTEKTALLDSWTKHMLRNMRLTSMLKAPNQEYQRLSTLSELTDRSLVQLNFFKLKDGVLSTAFEGKALVRVVSRDGSFEKKIWVVAKEQAVDLILMDSSGNVLATSSEEAKNQLLKQQEEAKKAALGALKAKYKETLESQLPSDNYLEVVTKAINYGLVTEASYKGIYTKQGTRMDFVNLLMKAFEIKTKKTPKKIETYYYTDLKNQNAEWAFQLGLYSGNTKRTFLEETLITSKEVQTVIEKWIKASQKKVTDTRALNELYTVKTSYTKQELIELVYKLVNIVQ